MRQIRIQTDQCSDQRIISRCQDDYHSSNEEKRSFTPAWLNETTQQSNFSIEQAFRYRSEKELNSYTYAGSYASYPGDGYAYELRGRLSDLQINVSRLHRLQWIDDRTRAVIIQLNLYNPNVQLFTSIYLVVEFLSTGDLHPTIRIDPMSFSGTPKYYSRRNEQFLVLFSSLFQPYHRYLN